MPPTCFLGAFVCQQSNVFDCAVVVVVCYDVRLANKLIGWYISTRPSVVVVVLDVTSLHAHGQMCRENLLRDKKKKKNTKKKCSTTIPLYDEQRRWCSELCGLGWVGLGLVGLGLVGLGWVDFFFIGVRKILTAPAFANTRAQSR